jgi:hypothetical protein
MNEKLLLQLIEDQKENANKMGRVVEIVERHDKVTFPEMNDTLKRMESKQNRDIIQWNDEKEKLNDRLKPLEEDYKVRTESKRNIKKNVGEIVWEGIKKAIFVIVTITVAKLSGFFK